MLCGYGGIGRHARFRFWCASVQVQVLLSALFKASVFYRSLFEKLKKPVYVSQTIHKPDF